MLNVNRNIYNKYKKIVDKFKKLLYIYVMTLTFSEYAKQNQMLWLAPKQVAKLMQCSVEHIYDLVKFGKVCYIKDGKNIRFKPEDLDEYEKNSYVRRN